MDTPAADIDIDAPLVARLVAAQHPDLAGTPALAANGWDNALYRLGDELCVRLPRRRVAAGLLRNEQRWLPVLAERVRVPVPAPVRVGRPSEDYPWPWSITPWFAGRPAVEAPPAVRTAIAAELAEFTAELHGPAPAGAPHNPVRGMPLASRAEAVRGRLADPRLPHGAELRRIWDEAAAAPPWEGPPVWLHGDLHPGNILLTDDPGGGAPRLAAVIDFGDLTAGDPATDLAAAWLVFDAGGRAAFRARVDELCGTGAATWARARGWAIGMASAVALNSADAPHMAAMGAHALEQALLDG
ncbi:aminoglycoside phosphotransferase family protein [Allonocardiopsis opalescens]|uniref:Aminoglycoside phosphotransferase (APT) family kinase protein n=1 Tax=Allonocardiopsis opalescens TaxID=1144618 RepID=A0A2T0Q2P3_9ACTN|nr:aminoglycoside phosphotransferase family protein [Allonocardiopsis opalescens]PRX98067.1 aminoglycoside phosphotransferase (APT) family kinase protein [Allonocardiopsis opalescens]